MAGLATLDALVDTANAGKEIGLSMRLMPGMEIKIGQVVYVPLNGKAMVEVGQRTVPHAIYLWVAHTPEVLAMSHSEGGIRYGLETRPDLTTVLKPEATQGQTLTLFGRVDMPERELLNGTAVGSSETTQVTRRFPEPYFVAVGVPGKELRYANVPEVNIKF